MFCAALLIAPVVVSEPVGHVGRTGRPQTPNKYGIYTGKESALMAFSERIVSSFVVVVVLLISHAGCVQDQAPGDGVAICAEEIVNGEPNPFFSNRPVYSANERPLMDSRDYNRLLQESGDAYVPWQSLDRDNNNTNMVVTEVRTIAILNIIY